MAQFTNFSSYVGNLIGTIDGTNAIFQVTSTPTFPEVYRNGLLVEQGINYTWDGAVTFTFLPGSVPQVGDDIQIWVYQQ